MKRAFLATLVVAILNFGCASDPAGRMAQSVIGATVGGAVGAGLGYAISGNSQGTGRGAAAGAAVGALGGFLSPSSSYGGGYRGGYGNPYEQSYRQEAERLRREEYYRWLQNERQRGANDARRDYQTGSGARY